MDSLRGRGAVPPKVFTTGHSGAMLDLGDMAVDAGHRVEGKIVLSDNKPVPLGTRLLLSRDKVRDTSTCELGLDGSFKFSDVPAKSLGLSVRIKGYKFSKRNPSLDWFNGGIVGKVDCDITGLILLMEPGQWSSTTSPKTALPTATFDRAKSPYEESPQRNWRGNRTLPNVGIPENRTLPTLPATLAGGSQTRYIQL